ncbi:hypothetical protein [Salipaludibacillus sp. CF4.18]|uniref:hypothetical protein n=1 Tax=Salipaludibacillus sp. CF4.18 TaxID=3373081 RepID=UPI003EE645DC
MRAVKNINKEVIGHSQSSIKMGDGGVVTKVKKRKLNISYIPTDKENSSGRLLSKKEDELFKYLINSPIFQESLNSINRSSSKG